MRRVARGRPGRLALDIAPRLTAPNPRIDAIRGCLAVERGPLVYCVERQDLPEGVDLADIAPRRRRARRRTRGRSSGSPACRGHASPAASPSVDGWSQVEYRDIRELPAASAPAPAVPLLAIPYFAWANRGAGAMRVWIPDAG